LQGPEALSEDQLLERAERAFFQGARACERPEEARPFFQTAADAYAELRQRGHQNAVLLRNEGNASLLAGDLPRAILAYRRGLRLAPGDRFLRANLAAAREQVVLAEDRKLGRPPEETRPPWLPWVGPGWRLLLGLGFYCLTCFALARWWLAGSGWLGIGAASGLITILLALSVARDELAREQETVHPLAVVARDGVVLRKGNGLAYPARYEQKLNRGVEGRVLFARGAWIQIELAGGELGWVPANAVLVDSQG
jgi:hypothetical protein